MNDLETILTHEGEISEGSKSIITAPLPAGAIKKRSAGYGKDLSYISGATVIDLLNKAFNYKWSFVVKDQQFVQAEKKKNGEMQPPYVQVLGQLIVPSIGVVKEQYGTKTILGGSAEQEGVAKAAATDALKKCATLLGIGLELYEDDTPPAPAPNNGKSNSSPRPTQNTQSVTTLPWDTKDTDKLKELKAILEVVNNNQLDPYVREFVGKAEVTYKDITPMNIKAFNAFLQKKAEEV